jgi:hypothetical protein
VRIAADVDEAIALGGAEPGVYDLEALAAAFPVDLWVAGEPAPGPPSLVQMPAAWLLEAGECWAARQADAPLKDEPRRLGSEVLTGFRAEAESLGDIEQTRGMELVTGAAEGVDFSELSSHDRSAATLVARATPVDSDCCPASETAAAPPSSMRCAAIRMRSC